jgi:hypothetical protein
MRHRMLTIFSIAVLAAFTASAESISLPPSGGNQRQTVIQHIGLVTATIDYSSPHVHSPAGEDRHGKIYGTLVPYGLTNLGFGPCKSCPWRAGANENTTFEVSNDVMIDGQKLPAGKYGLHLIADPNEWTVVFSKNSTSWGSFFYDPAEDQLRVKVKPQKSDYHEVLSWEFPERKQDTATVAMKWEDLAVPFTITVPNQTDLYLAKIRQELRNSPGFDWENWQAAANFALTQKHPVEALEWAEGAAHAPNGIGEENFLTLVTLSEAQSANGKTAEAKISRDKALAHPAATPMQIHGYARQLLQRGKKEEALEVWQFNAKRYGEVWPITAGLARGYSAVGKFDLAAKYAKLAASQAPDEGNKKAWTANAEKLAANKDINQ